ncbi:MAG TPA: PAS domain-containing protein, partial [Burkholderiales bacterium]|nr:PAS domain-containing protein [Burkholderiales bacterium]
MNPPSQHCELERIEALDRYAEIEPSIGTLKEVAQAAASACGTPIALLSFVEENKIRHRIGVGTLSSESPRDGSFANLAIQDPGVFVVTDALGDARFKGSPLVSSDEGVRFYAGAPLRTSDGHAIGVLEVMDRRPRELETAEEKVLAALADAAMAHMELERKARELEQAKQERDRALNSARASEERYALVVRSANDGLWDWNLETNEMHFCPRWKAILGFKDDEISGRPDEWFSRVHPDDIEAVQTELTSHLMGLSPHFQKEHRVRDHDGEYRWLLSRGLAVWDSNRHVYRMSGSITDVT